MKKLHLNILSSAILMALGHNAVAATTTTVTTVSNTAVVVNVGATPTSSTTSTTPTTTSTSTVAAKPEGTASSSTTTTPATTTSSTTATPTSSTSTTSATPTTSTTTTTKPVVLDSTATPSTKPTVTDALGTPTTTKPSVDYSKLDAKAVAALSLDVVASLTAKQIAALTPDAVSGFTAKQLANISPDAMKGFTAEQIAKLNADAVKGFVAEQLRALDPNAAKGFTAAQIKNITPEAFRGFTAKHIGNLSNDAISAITADQFSLMTRSAVAGFTVAQFKNLRLEVLSSLNASNIGGLSRDVLRAFGLDLLTKLDIKEIKKLTSIDVTWIFLNIDTTQVKPTDIQTYLPTGFSVDTTTGKLTLPAGPVSLPPVTVPTTVANNTNVQLPSLPDLTVSLNIGGTSDTTNIINQVNNTLIQINYPQFTATQTDAGILKVKGTGTATGVDLALVADQDSLATVSSDVKPGLYVDGSGNYVLITNVGMKLTLLPVSQDPVRLTTAIPNCKVKMSSKGETRLELPTGKVIAGKFSAFVEPAPANAKPGITIQGTAGVDEVATVVYEDGTMQKMYPSVQNQDSIVTAKNFLSDAAKYIKYKFTANGDIEFLYGDIHFISKPTFDIQVNYTTAQARPVINVLSGGKQAELLNEDGERQVFNLEIVGDSTTYQDN